MKNLPVPKYLLILPVIVACAGAFVLISGTNTQKYATAIVQKKDITQEVLASGNVAAPKNIDLRFQGSGRVASVFVSTGDTVRSGQVLAELDTSVLAAQRAQAASVVLAQEAQLRSLQEGTRPEQLAVTASQVQSDEVSLAQAAQLSSDALNNAYSAADSAIKNTADQLFSNPQTSPTLAFLVSNASAKSAAEESRTKLGLTLALWQQSISAKLSAGDQSGAESLASANLQQTATALENINTALSYAVTTSDVSAAKISGWMNTVAGARSSISTAIATLTAASTARKNAAATLERDKKNLALQHAGSTNSALDAQEAQVQAAKANVSAIDAQIAQMRIVSPIGGVITDVRVEEGESVGASTEAISMIPDSRLQVDVNVSEDVIAGVKLSDPVRITLDAFGAAEQWHGVVAKIDPAQTLIGGAVYYKTTVAFDQSDASIKPGMSATTLIQTGAASSTLVVPASAVSQSANGPTVSVVRNGATESRSVITGLKSKDGMIEILRGLQEGDVVVTGTN
jgi:RND family efflux transporter MFP subunit